MERAGHSTGLFFECETVMGIGCSPATSRSAFSLPSSSSSSSSSRASTPRSKGPASDLVSTCHLRAPTASVDRRRIVQHRRQLLLPRSRAAVRNMSSSLLYDTEKEGRNDGAAVSETRVGAVAQELVEEMVSEALVWSSLHGLLVGDRNVQRSGTVPGVGLTHAPISLLPTPFPKNCWRQACELATIFNKLVDRVSLDGEFLQESLSRTKKVDAFTGRLLDLHNKMMKADKKEDIRLGLHRSDYMLDAETGLLYQIELNTISVSFCGLSCLVSDLHRNLLNHYGKPLGLDSRKIPGNTAVSRYAEALAKAWNEYNDPSAIVLVVVQPEERNMYDQHWVSAVLKERHNVTTLRKTLAEIDAEGVVLPDGTLQVGSCTVAVVYFRAGYSPNDYPSEAEWRARFLMEESSAIKCPSISYHLVGTKKIQQELAKPSVLERFLDNKDDIEKLQKSFAGLWSLDNSDIVNTAIKRPESFVLKPQREGGGNNIYGDDVRDTIVKLQAEGSEQHAAYILMQRIFPKESAAYLVRDGTYHQVNAISELGIFGAYLRNKDKVIVNDQCGYLLRTKASSSNEGGVASGYAVLDSIYLT